MSTPPSDPSEKLSTAEQAKEDLKNSVGGIATSAAKGAATGGLAGAAVGAVKGVATAAVKTKTGKKAIAAIIIAPILVITLVLVIVFGGGSGSSGNAMNSIKEASAQTAAAKDVGDDEALGTLTANAYRTGVRWEILAAIYVDTKQRSAYNGTGPMGIFQGAKDISHEDMLDLDKSSMYIGGLMSEASAEKLYTVGNYNLDAGYDDFANEEDAKSLRQPTDTDEAKKIRDEVRGAYIDAIKKLPLAGNPSTAKKAFEMAQKWAIGKAESTDETCKPADGSGDFGVGDTKVALTEDQKKNAQEIINAVAARNMSEQAAVVALATAMTESTLTNVNFGDDGDGVVNPDGTPTSSLGLFQQQKWWGSVEDRMNPTKATGFFLDALVKVPGWSSMSVTQAAQAVQVSGLPDAYAKWEAQSRQLVRDMPPTNGSSYAHPEDHSEASSDSSIDASIGSGSDGVELPDVPNPHNLTINNVGTIANVQAAEKVMIQKFGNKLHAIHDVGGGGEHAAGRAIDLMLIDYATPEGKAVGDQISQFFINNEAAFNVEYIIFNDRIWLGQAEGWKPYRGGGYGGMYAGNWNDTTLHLDHNHITFRVPTGTGGDLSYTSPGGQSSECGGSTGIGTGASGAGDDYPFRNPTGVCAWCDESVEPAADPWALYKRECVSFVAWRMNQQMGWKEGAEYPFTMAKMGLAGKGSASYWRDGLVAKGYIADDNPAVGAIAWWGAFTSKPGITTGEAGHVGVVKEVKADGTVVIEQYNFTPWQYDTMTIPKENVDAYIHVADLKK